MKAVTSPGQLPIQCTRAFRYPRGPYCSEKQAPGQSDSQSRVRDYEEYSTAFIAVAAVTLMIKVYSSLMQASKFFPGIFFFEKRDSNSTLSSLVSDDDTCARSKETHGYQGVFDALSAVKDQCRVSMLVNTATLSQIRMLISVNPLSPRKAVPMTLVFE
ncbi:hypothetical protein E4T43_00417 [Aureobasidium subglaciale]|nr:hypothetical protein E4T43_00417 [Aureobasidium subglaciale]